MLHMYATIKNTGTYGHKQSEMSHPTHSFSPHPPKNPQNISTFLVFTMMRVIWQYLPYGFAFLVVVSQNNCVNDDKKKILTTSGTVFSSSISSRQSTLAGRMSETAPTITSQLCSKSYASVALYCSALVVQCANLDMANVVQKSH